MRPITLCLSWCSLPSVISRRGEAERKNIRGSLKYICTPSRCEAEFFCVVLGENNGGRRVKVFLTWDVDAHLSVMHFLRLRMKAFLQPRLVCGGPGCNNVVFSRFFSIETELDRFSALVAYRHVSNGHFKSAIRLTCTGRCAVILLSWCCISEWCHGVLKRFEVVGRRETKMDHWWYCM